MRKLHALIAAAGVAAAALAAAPWSHRAQQQATSVIVYKSPT